MAIDYNQLKETLIKELALEGLPAERQEELLSKMFEGLLKRIFLSTMEKLGERGVAEYEKILDGGASAETIAAFVESRIPEYDAFVQNIVTAYREELKNIPV